MTTSQILDLAAGAKRSLAAASSEKKNEALRAMAAALRENVASILAANSADIDALPQEKRGVMVDRLRLTEARIESMAASMEEVCLLPDPVGITIDEFSRPNGLTVKKVTVPMGVLAMIYESRPNVTSDAAALSLKSGSVCVLRGGKEAINSNKAVVDALHQGLKNTDLPEEVVCLITDTSRQSATDLMHAVGKVDLLIPRGGAGLIRTCVEEARVPVIETGTGICHIYIDDTADLKKAVDIVVNAKTSRPSVCNACEVCLVNKAVAKDILPMLKKALVDDREAAGEVPVELRLSPEAAAIIPGTPAGEKDFDTEFLNYILAIKLVDDTRKAIEHIAAHSTGHSEAIITQSSENAALFTALVDSAAVYVNASTRFTDGGEFGLGCEMGISTQKLHARGPMGLRELVSYKYIINGNGHVR